KQIIYFAVSLLLIVLLSFLDLMFLKTNSYLILIFYSLSLLSLAGLLVFGEITRGIRGWYKIGPISLDPVPLSAIVLIIVLAKYFSSRHIELKTFKPIVLSAVYVALPGLLVFLQPDLGSALTLVAIWFGIVVFSGIKLKHFFILCLIFLVLFAVGWKFVLKDYQKQRISSFMNPALDQQGISWSVNQSKIAIGSGGLLGQGITHGTQTQYGFLSEPKTDFIFSTIAEEGGFVGAVIVLGLLLLLFWMIIRIAFRTDNNLTRLFASGFGFLILSQASINLGMCLGLLPVIGLPLPFVSYGGSQLLAFYTGLGILMSLEKKD
ncbi:MAG: rod shape-determining protein RodA, partial [Parcubacteria group bacterium]|nr:rod shape-determining protein RodA [Parcubacteria group bacterium]